MKGIAYAVGVGPGDPELMTLKAVRLIRETEIISVPGKTAEESVAYKIAIGAVPELADKEILPINMPMIRDRARMAEEHKKGAELLESYLKQGKNIVFLTLGDPTVYCTFSYLQHIMEADGFRVELVPGITSFCAAAARLNLPLAEWDEPIHILPAAHKTEDPLDQPGTYVLMKSASHMKEIKQQLRESKKAVCAVENCYMENEHIYRNVEEIPDDAGYYSLIVAKESR